MQLRGKASMMSQRMRLVNALKIISVCTALGLLYPVVAAEFDDSIAFLNGLLIGFSGGCIIALHQDKMTFGRSDISMPFIFHVFLVTLGYTVGFAVLILLIMCITRGIETGIGTFNYALSEQFRDFMIAGDFRLILAWTLFFSLVLSFSFNISKKVAGGVLARVITGAYSKPREEHRVFMFVDLDNATMHAERMGGETYYRFLNDFFADITPAIMLSGGAIYRYVGDQVAISWLLTNTFDRIRCIRTYFMIKDLLEDRVEYYLNTYNVFPTCKASIHEGVVTTGEIGDIKAQIVFHGDSIYVTEQLERECRRLGRPLLVSGSVLNRIELPGVFNKIYCDSLIVEGAGDKIDLYAVEMLEADESR